jgi:hypothetical protein
VKEVEVHVEEVKPQARLVVRASEFTEDYLLPYERGASISS